MGLAAPEGANGTQGGYRRHRHCDEQQTLCLQSVGLDCAEALPNRPSPQSLTELAPNAVCWRWCTQNGTRSLCTSPESLGDVRCCKPDWQSGYTVSGGTEHRSPEGSVRTVSPYEGSVRSVPIIDHGPAHRIFTGSNWPRKSASVSTNTSLLVSVRPFQRLFTFSSNSTRTV